MGKLFVLAENRSNAPAYFCLCVYAEEPTDDSRIILDKDWDPRDDPNFLFMIQVDKPTDPGKWVQLETEANYEPKINKVGPKLHFRTPPDMSKKFILHKIQWNGKSLIRQPGWI